MMTKFQMRLAVVLEFEDLTEKQAEALVLYYETKEKFDARSSDDLEQVEYPGSRRRLGEKAKKKCADVLSGGIECFLDESLDTDILKSAVLIRRFIRTQLAMIGGLTLSKLSPNPFLVRALNLNTPEQVIRLNVHMRVTRSMVTSLGYLNEDLLVAASSGTAEKLKSKWDLKKVDKAGEKHWIQVKSGTNDMDKDQIKGVWKPAIEEKLSEGDHAYIGITYGKRTDDVVSLGLLNTYLDDVEKVTLIGRELWDFISDETDYHAKLFDVFKREAERILDATSIIDEIDKCAEKVLQEFIVRYGEGEAGVSKYLNDRMV